MSGFASAAAVSTIVVPAFVAVVGLPTGRRSLPWAREWAVLGAGVALVAALVEAQQVATRGPQEHIAFLGRADLGSVTVPLALRADGLSASVSVAVALVALCVQVYSTAYLHGRGTPDAPTRYPAYAAEVSLFTAAMMLVVHADDLLLLLVGWEVMGLCSYLLVGHHSERPAARAAAMKAFLVTRVGDLGVLLAVVVLLVRAGTTSVGQILARAGELPPGTATLAACLLLVGAIGKSAQFPLHTWLPDAMEGPTPVSALIHAATMVAAGVFLVARMLPLFLAAEGALAAAAVVASVTMLGAALAAAAQDDLKRLLAWSTVSQVAYMLGALAVARTASGTAPAVLHLLSHAAFKALLFLAAGCVTHLVGSTLVAAMGGLGRTHRELTVLWGVGLAALAGLPPLAGFWSKESVLGAAAEAAAADGGWPARTVLVAGLLTTLVTGVYAGRAFAVVVLDRPGGPPRDRGAVSVDLEGEPSDPRDPAPHVLPTAMTGPLWLLAAPTVLLGGLLLVPPGVLRGVHLDVTTGLTGTVLAAVGVALALAAPLPVGRDVADVLPHGLRALLRDGYRLDAVQEALVARPYAALARLVRGGDRDVVDAYVRGVPVAVGWGGRALRRAQSGLATGYLAWLVLGAVLAGLAGVVLT